MLFIGLYTALFYVTKESTVVEINLNKNKDQIDNKMVLIIFSYSIYFSLSCSKASG